MSDQPQSKFAQAFDRLSPQLTSLKLDFDVQGVFAFPEEWKTVDEANPGLFQYFVRFGSAELLQGKILPREQTEREKFEEQIQGGGAAQGKQSKKPGKKVEINPEDEEKLKKMKEEEEALELEFQELPEEERFYKGSEDRFRSPSIKWESNQFSLTVEERDLLIFEERVKYDKGEYIFLAKQPTLSEEELAKLRKSKPKTLNLVDLNTIVFRAWIDFTDLNVEGATELVQRIKFEQYMDEQSPPDTPQPNVSNTYLFFQMRLSQPVVPVKKLPIPSISDVVPPAPEPVPLHPSQVCIKELRAELELIIESLAMEYSSMFSRELNAYQEGRTKNMLLTHKKQDLQKRKEHFLYDFNISGKYKILKERIKKSIVKICRDKFGKTGAITGITQGQEDQFYSELYVFLMEQMRSVLVLLVKEKKEILLEDQLLTKEYAEKVNQAQLMNFTNEQRFDMLNRLAEEYELLNDMKHANKHLKDLMKINQSDHVSLFKYTLFCVRAKLFKEAEDSLEKAISRDQANCQYQALLASIYFYNEHYKEAIMVIRLLLEVDSENLLYNIFYYLVVKDEALKKKQLLKCERLYLRSTEVINQLGTHKESPSLFDMPWIRIPVPPPDKPEKDKAVLEKMEQQKLAFEQSHQQPEIEQEQRDEMFAECLQYFAELNLFPLCSKVLAHVEKQDTDDIIVIQSKIAAFNDNFEEAIEKLDQILAIQPGNYQVMLTKGELQYKNNQLQEAEQTFLLALKTEAGSRNFALYLRLGYLYLKKQEYGNARAVLTKACALKNNSSLTWLGLGIACNKSQLYKEAESALSQANIYEPTNGKIWAYISLNALQDNGRFLDANQALRELNKTDFDDIQILAELSKEFYNQRHYNTAKSLFQKVLDLCELQDYPENTPFQIDLAKTYEELGQIDNAKELFQEALMKVDDEQQRNEINNRIQKLEYQKLIKN